MTSLLVFQVWFQNRRARSIKTGRFPQSTSSDVRGGGFTEPSPNPPSATLADVFRQDPNHYCEEAPHIYSDWIQVYSSPVSSTQPPSSSLHQQPTQKLPKSCSKLPDSCFWEEERHRQPHVGSKISGLIGGSFPQPISRQSHHPASSSYQAFANFKPHALAPSGNHQPTYGAHSGGGPMDQVIPAHPQPMYWEAAQGQGHRHQHHHHHHPQVGPQTSMGYISDLIYNAAIVTNFLEF